MDTQTVKKILKEDMPVFLKSNKEVRQVVLQLTKEQYTQMDEKVESRFELLLAELKRDREEQTKKWDEHNKQLAEQNKQSDQKWAEHNKQSDQKWAEHNKQSDQKWAEQNKKWDEKWAEQDKRWEEQNKKWDEKWAEQDKRWAEQDKRWAEQDKRWAENRQELNEMKQAILRLGERYDSTIGAVGARWGHRSEASFRNAISGILEKFNVKVSHVDENDTAGVVFGRPASVELDIVIINGELLIGELKSSLSKGDISIFFKKVDYYQKKYNVRATSLFVISPMIDRKAQELAAELGIKVYNHSDQMGEALAIKTQKTD